MLAIPFAADALQLVQLALRQGVSQPKRNEIGSAWLTPMRHMSDIYLKRQILAPSGTLESYTDGLRRLATSLRSLEAHFVRNEGVRPVAE